MKIIKLITRYFLPGSEGLRQFLTLIGQWWREIDGGRLSDKEPTIISNGTNGKMKAYLKHVKCPIRLLPAIRAFKIKVGTWDKLCLAFGLRRRQAGTYEFEVHSPNLHINRYIVHMVERLDANRSNPRKYWAIADQLMRSSGYLVCCLQHVLHGWHRDLPYWLVLKIAKKVEWMCTTRDHDAKIKRVYIEKASGKWRPLGVPTPAWRIYSHMMQNLLTFYLQSRISPSQHGFLPGRGVITAWQEVLAKAAKASYIKEYDLRNFFGEVAQDYVSNSLRRAKIPESWVYLLENIHRSKPNLKEQDLVDEGRIRNAVELEQYRTGEITKTLWKDFIKFQGEEMANFLLEEFAYENGYQGQGIPYWEMVQGFLEEQWAILSSFPKPEKVVRWRLDMSAKGHEGHLDWYERTEYKTRSEGFGEYFYGLPQGLPTSPLLSIYALNECFTSVHKQQVAYADDFITYGNTPEACELRITDPMKACNVQINEDKSGWVKKEGQWLKPLQFLGMNYDGKIFRANTRNGATLEFTSFEALCSWLERKAWMRERKEKPDSGDAWNIRQGMASTLMDDPQAFLANHLWQGHPLEDWKGVPRRLLKVFVSQDLEHSPWEELMTGRLLGYFFSRMQSDSWKISIDQDFSFTYKPRSWAEVKCVRFLRQQGISNPVTVFNSSSFAAHCLLQDLSKERNVPWDGVPRIHRYFT